MKEFKSIDVPRTGRSVQYGPDPVTDVLNAEEHRNLSRFLLRLIAGSEERRQDQIGHMLATEMDLLGIVENTASDCERDKKREKGEDVSVPDAIYPFGYLELQKFAAEVMAIAMPIEAPYAVVTDVENQEMANALVQIFRGQSAQFDHRNNIHAAAFDALALQLGGVSFEVKTKKHTVSQAIAGAQDVVGADDFKGLFIKHLDPYNITYDHSVPLPHLAAQGEFFAEFGVCTAHHIKREKGTKHYLSRETIKLLDNVTSIDDEHGSWDRYKAETYQGWHDQALPYNANWYYLEPSVAKTRKEVNENAGRRNQTAQTDFADLYQGANGEGYAENPRQFLQTIRMFVRIVPHEWGLGPKLNNNEKEAAPYEMWEIGLYGPGYIGYAKPAVGAFNEFPVALFNMNFDKKLGRSIKFGEHAAQLGLLSSTLMNMYKRSLRKGLEGGLTLYNPDVFDFTGLSEMSGGRVPAKAQRFDDDIRRHIMQLADTPDTQHTPQHAKLVTEMLQGSFPANSAPAMAGLDRATTYQAQAVTMTSQRVLAYYATLVDAGLMGPTRNNLLTATLKNPQDITYVDDKKGQLVQVAASEIGKAIFQLVQSQPLMGIDRLRSETLLRDMINVTLQSGGQLSPVAALMMRHYSQIAGINMDVGDYEEAVAAEERAFAAEQERKAAEAGQGAQNGAPPVGPAR